MLRSAVDVRLSGEVHDRIASAHCPGPRRSIADIATNKPVVWVPGNGLQIQKVAGISELVVIDSTVAARDGKNVPDEVGADEPGAAGHKYFHFCLAPHGDGSGHIHLVGSRLRHQIVGA